MKKHLTLLVFFGLWISMTAQVNVNPFETETHTVTRVDLSAVNPDWAPFYHGVASGDPLADAVIIWTRVTPGNGEEQSIDVSWKVATDAELTNVVQSGTYTTSANQDYTVKVDVTGLSAGTTYYYGFNALGKNSLTGKTKTTPTGDQAEHLKFGVVSCSNFEAGYFNAYQRLSDRNDLDAIIHLGDYIYEQVAGSYGDTALFGTRTVQPTAEILSVEDYRLRYSTYRLDTMLTRLHQQFPFVTVWDDHESANDAYKDGAENHQADVEGDWETRKAVSKQVYFEWMPIRDNDDQDVYRTLSYGNLVDLIMLDTRLEGREEQILDISNPALFDTARTILGTEQKSWFLDQLANSTAKWKIVGQQVIFSEFNVGWAAFGLPPTDPPTTFNSLESIFLDIWDGYPAERAQVINFIDQNEIDNVVFLTGDFHCAFAYDVAAKPVDLSFPSLPGIGSVPLYQESDTYNPTTGEGAIAVEFATPSITSANFDENVGLETAIGLQFQINNDIELAPGASLGNPNPHLKYVDLIQSGFFILDIKADSVQANWYYTPINIPTDTELFGAAYYTKADTNHLVAAVAPSADKLVQDERAPANPPSTTTNTKGLENQNFVILGSYPNPFLSTNILHYSVNKAGNLNISLFDANGKFVQNLVNQEVQAGLYQTQLDGRSLSPGTYIYQISLNDERYSTKVILKK